ncbi:MAG: hypothetical protein Q8J74_13945 [Candidatus Didemnitutus sp.]|nr:hypothetical protein [Candidatus Didemnitutus sp.]
MKDTRFTELVNLYIDRQISPEDAAEFELEIQSNSKRRQVYRHYCRMHRATALVYESFRTHSDQAEAPAASRPATIAHLQNRQRQRRTRWLYATGGLAAAASLALVFGRMNLNETSNAPSSIALTAAAPMPTVVAETSLPTVTGGVPESRASLTNLRSSQLDERDYTALLATLRQEEQRLLSLGQTGNDPARISLFNDGLYEQRQVFPTRAPNSLPNRRQRGTAEFTAFQFQR